MDVASALEQLQTDKKTPVSLKFLINHILSFQSQMSAILAKNQELNDQIRNLREENYALKLSLADAERKLSPSSVLPNTRDSCCCDEHQRRHSVVISGITESESASPSARAKYDCDFVSKILDHLDVQCTTDKVYRLGKPREDRCRLIKVVLPTTYFQNLVIRRAPRLRSFSYKGVFIRPSLTKEERERSREARSANRSAQGVNVSDVQSQRSIATPVNS